MLNQRKLHFHVFIKIKKWSKTPRVYDYEVLDISIFQFALISKFIATELQQWYLVEPFIIEMTASLKPFTFLQCCYNFENCMDIPVVY